MQTLETILKKTEKQFISQLPFVIFCKPDSNKITAHYQKNGQIYFTENFTDNGFIFAPFDGSNFVLIPENQSEVLVSDFVISDAIASDNFKNDENPEAKSAFESLVKKGISAIEKGKFEKVVLSRKESVEIKDFDFIAAFEKLLNLYQTAFRYCWFHPKIGFWMGATPERLLKADGKSFYTMALAGTQAFQGSESVIWEEKEKEEQRFVTNFITHELSNIVSEMTISEPYTTKAGNLLHIKTDVEGVLNEDSTLKNVLQILHPTPAVCGLPKSESKAFILENEGYHREYYSGFLGEINSGNEHQTTDIFVNLRCMQIRENLVDLYIGCGITKDSNPEKEYFETVNKSLTMKKVIF